MYKKLLYLILVGILVSCSNDNNQNEPVKTNKVVLLKIDFVTTAFEGGKEIEFAPSPNFTISTTYQEPGDFGGVQLFYDELNEMIFDGTIIWNGLGDVSYPSPFIQPEDFTTISNPITMPSVNMFENVMYHVAAYYPDTINYSDLWNAINNLEIVSNYLDTNPDQNINLFLYTPSVGVGNPEEWDWYVIIKN